MIEHQITKIIADINKTVEELQKTRDLFQNHVTAADINNNFVDENRCLILENSELKKRNAALEKEISDMKISNITRPEEKDLDYYIKRIVEKENTILSLEAEIRSLKTEINTLLP